MLGTEKAAQKYMPCPPAGRQFDSPHSCSSVPAASHAEDSESDHMRLTPSKCIFCATQEAMRTAQTASTDDCPVKVKLVAPPLYVLTTSTLDKNKGIEVLNQAIELCQAALVQRKGAFKVKEAPRTVSERDDLLLQTQVGCMGAAQVLTSHMYC